MTDVVFLMRQQKFLGVGEALDVMHEARTMYWSEDAAEHVESNWRGLLKVQSKLRMIIVALWLKCVLH